MSDLSNLNTSSFDELYNNFVERINKGLYRYPSLQLDGTWPSLSVIDLLTFPLRKRFALLEEEERFIKEISAYLAKFISKVWSTCEYQPQIIIDPESGILIKALFEGKPVVLYVEQIYKKVLQEFDITIPIFDDFYRPCAFDTNVISGISLGLLTGLSPLFQDSPFRLYEEDRQFTIKKKIEKIIALDIASWFMRVHPDNPFVQIPEMYLKGFILPPFLMEESPPLVSAVKGLNDYLTQIKFPKSMYKSLGDMFASCLDEQVSLLGIAMLGSFSRIEDAPKASIVAAKSRRYATPLLRESITELRKRNFKSFDWTSRPAENNEEYNENKLLYDFDIIIGSLPWLSLTYDKIVKSKNSEAMFEIVAKCKQFYFSDLEKIINKMVEEEPSDLEVRIQQIKLVQIKGDFEQADRLCKKLISEPGADSYPDFFFIWASTLLDSGEPELAARYFRAARGIKNTPSWLKSDMLNNLGWCNIQLGLFREAKEALLEAEKLSFSPLTIYLNLAYLYALEKDEESRAKYLSYALKLAPYDRRVFANLI